MTDQQNNENDSDKIVDFSKHKKTQQDKWRSEYREANKAKHEPFLKVGNIPVFTKWMTVAILAISGALLILNMGIVQDILYTASFKFGFVPERFTSGFDIMALPIILTHTFIHGDFIHLAFNGIMLLALGTLFERSYGAKMTAVFFFTCVVAGAIMYLILAPSGQFPVIGASGGISGLFAATLVILHDQNRAYIRTSRFAKLGPWGIVGAWFILMLVIGFFSGANVAWQSHMGGYLAGAGLYALIRQGRFKL